MANEIAVLRDLGLRPLRASYQSKSNIVEKLEAALSRELPKSYAECLQVFNATSVFDRPVTFSAREPSPWSVNGKDRLQTWFADDAGGRSIFSVRTAFLAQLPESLLVIGEAPGSNPICLELDGEEASIFLWDHEGEKRDDAEKSNLYLIASDFSSFISSLESAADSGSAASGPKPKLLKGSTSPDLKAKAAEFLRQQKGDGRKP